VDPKEPDYLVKAVEKLKLSYVVITSVTRDDLYDGGASQFAKTVETINKYDPAVVLEVLIPDFKGSASALRTVVNSSPDVLGHNIETVASLYPKVRPKANYQYSMELLKEAKRLNGSLITKSGIMLGLGETHHEVIKVMEHLREVDCDIITIGQYLRPSLNNHPVVNFVSPEDFVEYENIGKQMGFRHIVSSPMVRSSFHAMETYLLVKQYNVIRSE
jgi:lipoic acid synthetase